MQSAFRATVRQLNPSRHPMVKQSGVARRMLTDTGNFPLIAANSVGAIAVCIFGARKIFFHPDIGVSDVNRFSNEIGNETPERLESARQFRGQTQLLGTILQPISSPIISLMTGSEQGTRGELDKWSLTFLRKQDDVMSPPLESTDAFDDGLFVDVRASEFARNEPASIKNH